MNALSEIGRRFRLLRLRIEASRQPLLAVADKAAVQAARLQNRHPEIAAHAWRLATDRRLYRGCRMPDLTLAERQAAGRSVRAARAAQVKILEGVRA